MPARGRLSHREDRLARQDEADLLVVDDVRLRHCACQQEDPEDVVAVPAERRPRLVLVLGRGEQELERALLELAWRARTQLLGARIEEIDPVRGHTAAGSTRRGL